MEITPQPGPQTEFLASKADLVIYGGSAGGGKSWGLLAETARHTDLARYGAVVFRRTTTMLRNQGGLWDESEELFSKLGGTPNNSRLRWDFKSGASVSFCHLEYEKDKRGHQGAQYAFIGFDELTHFTQTQFFYLLSRNRTLCGIKPYVRATCNPDADSWVKELITWWLDDNNEYADYTKSGVIRYFVRDKGKMIWGDTRQEVIDQAKEVVDDTELGGVPVEKLVKSMTFIPSNVYDNQILLKADPGYLGNLLSQNEVEKERLLKGNWKIRASSGKYFKREWFNHINFSDVLPGQTVRFWDFAATEPTTKNKNPDYTACLKLRLNEHGIFDILDVWRDRLPPSDIAEKFKHMTISDGRQCIVAIEVEPGSSGKYTTEYFKMMIPGYPFVAIAPNGSKEVRAVPVATLAKMRNFRMIQADWNEDFLDECEGFPVKDHDDQVDALTGAWRVLSGEAPGDLVFTFDRLNIVNAFDIPVTMCVEASVQLEPNRAYVLYRAIDQNNNWYFFMSETVEGTGEDVAQSIIEKKKKFGLRIVQVITDKREKVVGTLMENNTINSLHNLLYYNDIHVHMMKSDLINGATTLNGKLIPNITGQASAFVFQNMPTLCQEMETMRYEKGKLPEGNVWAKGAAMCSILNTKYFEVLKLAKKSKEEKEDEEEAKLNRQTSFNRFGRR